MTSRTKIINILSWVLLTLFSEAAKATDSLDPAESQAEVLVVPLIFSSDSLDTAFGGAGVIKHAGQTQAKLLGLGLYTTNDSWLSYIGAKDYQVAEMDQWLFSAEYFHGMFKEGEYYLDDPLGNQNPIITQGQQRFAKFHAQYILPIGWGKQGAISAKDNHDSVSWNPFNSGVTSFTLTPFMQSQHLDETEHLPQYARGLELMLNWDNRDNGYNSTQGGQTSLRLRHGFEADGGSDWRTWQFQQSAFFSLGCNDLFRQQVVAANVYVADTPSWEQNADGHRPPQFAGINLGGFERLRGYPGQRFSGRSAVLYSVEYRAQPYWQPLSSLENYDVPWWQWVMFAETGKVSDEFSLSSLHQDMVWTVGMGVRLQLQDVVVRAELARSEESSQFWIMVNQPF